MNHPVARDLGEALERLDNFNRAFGDWRKRDDVNFRPFDRAEVELLDALLGNLLNSLQVAADELSYAADDADDDARPDAFYEDAKDAALRFDHMRDALAEARGIRSRRPF